MIGPSGCGKTTLLRCLNRIHEVAFDARVQGRVLLDGQDIYDGGVDPMSIRRRIGMVFQRPNPFPTLSILDNALACAPRGLNRREKLETAERALRSAALWDEVKDKLRTSPLRLSGGQQQRLCIARAVAAQPDVLLMDEPTASLDPIATAVIEELMSSLDRGVHDRRRDAQHAAGGARLRRDGVHARRRDRRGQAHRDGRYREALYQAQRPADRGLHHRTIRIA